MPYNLLTEPWIPFRRQSGAVEWGPPPAITSQMDVDPVVAVATPRPDFDGALQEFLIGLLSVALEVDDEREWYERWHEPPSESDLAAGFATLQPAFDLDGDGPRFMQDWSADDFANVEVGPADHLLIDAPGDQTTRLNKDLFVKRGRVERLSRSSAAMALITLQTYAPGGGKGFRTSIRGGGPLTTLAEPRVAIDAKLRADDQPLWMKLWANIETLEQLGARVPLSRRQYTAADTFPWLAATRTSEKRGTSQGLETTPDDVHPFQAYFGMPRRVRLEFGDDGRCALTGRPDARTVTGFRERNYGVNYSHWHHPLSPYYKSKGELLPIHGQPGGIGWRDWLTLTFSAPREADRQPALVVGRFARRALAIGANQFRLHAFGYDMDKAKARGWTEASLPAIAPADEAQNRRIRSLAESLTGAADIVAAALGYAVKDALFASSADRRIDSADPRPELWRATESAFYDAIQSVGAPGAGAADSDTARLGFRDVLEREARGIFERRCSASGAAPQAIRRIVSAQHSLGMTLRGYGKLGLKLFETLGIPRPPGAERGVRKTRTKEKSA